MPFLLQQEAAFIGITFLEDHVCIRGQSHQ